MGLLDRIRTGTYVADGEPLIVPGRATALAEVGDRVLAGEGVLPAVRDFLDQLERLPADELARLVEQEPPATGDSRADALVAAIAEHAAITRGFACPRWTLEPDRFLDRFWFVSDTPGFRAIALAQTPVSLKRRGIFWPARSLRRV
ncbi:MAG: hypothetical protein MSC30_08085 [Gaiellaceae bacterium MAG52_C11]|nr:hypothetical protein [Candidatus Gaiellasilicea maunaloa]